MAADATQPASVPPWFSHVALVVVGAVLLWRVADQAVGTTRQDQARRAAAALRAQVQDRALTDAELDLPLERPAESAGAAGTDTLRRIVDAHEVVLLHFWATWCPPCLDELAALVRLAQGPWPRDVVVVAVSYDEDWASQRAALQRHAGDASPAKVLWWRDPQGQGGDVAAMLRTRLGTEKLPETWVIVDGRAVGLLVGAQPWDSAVMREYLAAVGR